MAEARGLPRAGIPSVTPLPDLTFSLARLAQRHTSASRSKQVYRHIPMSNAIEELTAKFRQTCEESGENEERVIERLTQRLHISRNVNREYEETLTLGQRLADRIAIFGGSWTFILLFLFLLLSWIVLNTIVLARLSKPFDPYP